MANHAQKFSTTELLRVIRVFNFAAGEARSAWQPALPLEMAFVEALEAPQVLDSAGPAASPGTPVTPPVKQAQSPKRPPPASAHTDAAQTDAAQEIAAPRPTEKGNLVVAEPGETDVQAAQKLAAVWQQILGLVRQQSQPAYGTLNSCTSRLLHGDQLTLTFASDVLKTKMEKPENLALLRAALQQVFGREIYVRCTVDTARRDTVPPGVEDDGIVAAALRDLGGELVDIN
jgi:DNA polymerase-3 subunit gamma/tau